MTTELTHRTATDLATLLATGEVSSVDVVSAHLDRIDEVNPTINAIVSMRDRDAILADARRADAGGPSGRLHGLPVAVKDLQDVAGLPTRHGSLTTSQRNATADGPVAARFRAEGAIIIGKTNTPEFGTGCHTFNEVFGTTSNPWNPALIAGGSSGGAAAALAARMLPIADGSDLGGSLRNPASMCNVVGLRTTVGRVADWGATTTHLRLGLEGPMGRTVADTALVLSALAGPHLDDPRSLPEPGEFFAGALPTTTSARLAWGGDLGLFTCDPEVLDVTEQAARSIDSVGGSISEAAPDMEHAMFVFKVLRGAAYRGLGNLIPEDKHHLLKATVRENIAYGRGLTVEDLLLAESRKADLHRTMSAFFGRFDVLALPAAQVPAFPVEVEYPTEIDGVAMHSYLDWMTACCIITPTECPAISIPAGFSADGRPIGLQLVARRGHERQLLEIAAAIESANSQHHLVPTI